MRLSCCTPTWKRRSLAQRRAASRMSCSSSTRARMADRSRAISAGGATRPWLTRGGGGGRLVDAQWAQRFERAGIVAGAGEAQVAARARQARRLLEQPRVVAFDGAQPLQQFRLEGGRIGVAEEGRDGGKAGRVFGQGVGLLVIDHLQAVLDAAQEAIGLDQLLGSAGRNMASGGQRAERLAGGAQAQRRIAAAEDQLLGL